MESYAMLKMFKRLDKILSNQKKILDRLDTVSMENEDMSAQMDALVQAVTQENTVIDGVVLLLESFSNRLAEINAQVTEINAQLAEALADDVADTELIAQLQAELEALNNQAVTLQQDVETRTADLAEAAATVPQPTPTPGPTDGSGTPTPTPTTPQTAAETAAQSAKDQVARDEKQAREMRNQSNRR